MGGIESVEGAMPTDPPAPDLGAIRALIARVRSDGFLANNQTMAAVAHLLAAYDAQTARLAALEESLALLLDAVGGPPWVLPSGEYLGACNRARELLGITGAVGAGEARDG
jgi:hypothetical protein